MPPEEAWKILDDVILVFWKSRGMSDTEVLLFLQYRGNKLDCPQNRATIRLHHLCGEKFTIKGETKALYWNKVWIEANVDEWAVEQCAENRMTGRDLRNATKLENGTDEGDLVRAYERVITPVRQSVSQILMSNQ